MRRLTQEDLDDLNNLVQAGLIEVVSIAAGEPSYRISSRYTVTILPGPEGAWNPGERPGGVCGGASRLAADELSARPVRSARLHRSPKSRRSR